MIQSFQSVRETPDILKVRTAGRNNGDIPITEIDYVELNRSTNVDYLIRNIESIISNFENKYFLLYFRRQPYIGYFVFDLSDRVPVMNFRPVFIGLNIWIKIFNPEYPDNFTMENFTQEFIDRVSYHSIADQVIELVNSNIITTNVEIFEIPEYYYKWFKLFEEYRTYRTPAHAYKLEKKRLTDKFSKRNPNVLDAIKEFVDPNTYVTGRGRKRSRKRRAKRKSRTT